MNVYDIPLSNKSLKTKQDTHKNKPVLLNYLPVSLSWNDEVLNPFILLLQTALLLTSGRYIILFRSGWIFRVSAGKSPMKKFGA